MKKRIVTCLLVGVMAVGTFTGCGDKKEDPKTEVKTEDIDENDDEDEELVNEANTDWYTSNPGAISSGVFVVGKDIKAGNYNYTVDYMRLDDTYSKMLIFENEESYKNYYSLSRNYDSDYNEYMSYILVNNGCRKCESMEANLVDGNIMVLSDTQGTLTGDAVDTNKKDLTLDKGKQYSQGLYQPGTLKTGTYIACNNSTDEDGRMSLVLFDSMDEYKACMDEEGVSVADWGAALAKYAAYDYVIYPGESLTFNVYDNTVVYIDFGTAYIQQVDMGWSAD